MFYFVDIVFDIEFKYIRLNGRFKQHLKYQ